MDTLFDSVNGVSPKKDHTKPLHCAVSQDSEHLQFWQEAIKMFESMKFIKSNGTLFVPPSVKNWILTLKGLRYLWLKLSKDGFKFLSVRNLNQDSLENFFGGLRSHGARNVNPTCHSFTNSFKSLLINNFLSPHSPGANCEVDEGEALECLKHFIICPKEINLPVFRIPEVDIPPYVNSSLSLHKKGTLKYIAGYIAKKVMKMVGICKKCRHDLIGEKAQLSQDENFVIVSRQYSPNALLFPTTNYNYLFQKCLHILGSILPKICHSENIKSVLLSICVQEIDNPFVCEKHNLFNLVIKYICNFHIQTWSKNINKILKGKLKIMKTSDPIKLQARVKYDNHKKASERIRCIKELQ